MILDEALTVTCGQQEAALFLVDYEAWCHMFDDLVDDDKPTSDEYLVKCNLHLIQHFLLNPWVKKYAEQLWPLFVVGLNAWLDANRMAGSSDERTRLSSDVVKSVYNELGNHVAFLCGGFEHMQKVSAERKYDYDQQKKGKE